jgi:hypothetical protein
MVVLAGQDIVAAAQAEAPATNLIKCALSKCLSDLNCKQTK